MNTRWLLIVLLCMPSAAAVAGDGALPLAAQPVGLWLISLGIAFLIAEAALPNYGVIGLAGIVMFVVGALVLNHTQVPAPLMLGLGLVSAGLLLWLLIRALKTRPRQAVSGDAGLLGSVASVTRLQPGDPCRGWVLLQGEQWYVLSARPLQPGQRVRVLARQGLSLTVSAADASPGGE